MGEQLELFWSSRYVRTQILRGQKPSGVSLKTLRFKPDLPVIPLPWFFDFFSFAGELVIPDNANVYYALNSSMESLLFKLKKKADEKPSWGMFSSLFPCLLWSCVLQVSFRQAELKKDKFLLVKIIGMVGKYFRLCRKWNFRETFYCDNSLHNSLHG